MRGNDDDSNDDDQYEEKHRSSLDGHSTDELWPMNVLLTRRGYGDTSDALFERGARMHSAAKTTARWKGI